MEVGKKKQRNGEDGQERLMKERRRGDEGETEGGRVGETAKVSIAPAKSAR